MYLLLPKNTWGVVGIESWVLLVFPELFLSLPRKSPRKPRPWFYRTRRTTQDWWSHQSSPMSTFSICLVTGSPRSLQLQGRESLLKNLNRRCVSRENKPRSGPTAPRRPPDYSIQSCVWLRFPLHCVKVVMKKYGLCGSKVFQGPWSMLNVLSLVKPG